MNLYKIYHDICNRGHERGTKRKKGYELHHIIPVSYFKSRKIATYNENLALLTPKEHYVVHHCLAKFGDPKMIFAFCRMVNSKGHNSHKISSKEYEILITIKNELISTNLKGKSKPPRTQEHKQKLKDAKIGYKPTNEHMEKLRLLAIGRKMTNENKLKLYESKIGKPRSEETKQKIRDAALKYYKNKSMQTQI